MKGLRFDSAAVLSRTLGAGLIPAEVASAAVEYWLEREDDPDGPLIVDASALPAKAHKALVELGVKKVAAAGAHKRSAPFWAAILRPEPAPPKGPKSGREDVVLFLTGDASEDEPATRSREGDSALALATELLVQGSERVEIATWSGGALVRAFRPSHYVVLRAQEPGSAVKVYAPIAPGSDSVFLELGYRHPAMSALSAAAGEILLVDATGAVLAVTPSAFRPVWDHLTLTVTSKAEGKPPIALAKRKVPLRLARAVTPKVATLWVLRQNGVAALDQLVESAPEEVLRALSFAAFGDRDAPTVVLSSSQPIPLYLDAEAYAPHAELGDVYIPIDRRVHPPVWADRLRAAVGGPDDKLRWLSPTQGGLCVESIASNKLAPLYDWVELVTESREVEPWLRSVAFEPQAFELLYGQVAPTRTKREREEKIEAEPRSRRAPRAPIAVPAPAPPPVAVPAGPRPRGQAKADKAAVTASETENEAALRDLETHFRAQAGALSAPERDDDWLSLARAYAATRLERDAALCRARLLFDGSPHGGVALSEWLGPSGQSPARLMAVIDAALEGEPKSGPMFALVAALAALAAARGAAPESVRGGAVSSRDLPAEKLAVVEAHLAEHGSLLCVRSLWLGLRAIVSLSGEDDLALARARDRVFARLENGLSLSRDLPRVVRAFDEGRGDRGRVLGDVLRFFEATPRAKSPVEAPPASTLVYVRLVFAIAFARTGESDRASALLGEARAKLDAKDPVHGALLTWFGSRMAQALEGDPESAPLPGAVLGLRDKLDRLQQYKIDRVRQSVKLLEPDTDLDPFKSFGLGGADVRSEVLRKIHAAKHAREMAAIIDAAWAATLAEKPEDRVERALGLLAAMAGCPVRVAATRLADVGALCEGAPAESAVKILMQALPLAERFETAEASDRIVSLLNEQLRAIDAAKVAELAPRIARGTLVIRHHEAREPFRAALTELYSRLTLPDVGSAIGRLALWRALSMLGEAEGAAATLASERALLERQLAPAQRLALIRALAATATALGRVDDVVALTREWTKTTDSYNTNSHLCLSAVELADAIASALVPQRGDAISRARRLADEDEWFARSRVLSEGEDPA